MTDETGAATPITADLVRGALELEPTDRGLLLHRLPARARAQAGGDGQLLMAESHPAGVRLVFRTAATVVELETHRTMMGYVGVPARPDCFYDLLVDGELVAQATQPSGDVIEVDMSSGAVDTRQGPAGTARFVGLPARDKVVELWLPWSETVRLVELRTDAPVEPVPATGRVWLHHGSSISQGSSADSPSTTWPALAAREAGVDLVNLGLAGSALLDPFTARAMRDTPADLVSVKVGINLVNLDLLRLRAFGPAVHGFLDTLREGHPTTPLLVVSPVLCPIHEHTPGPLLPDFSQLSEGKLSYLATGDPADPTRLTLTVIREQLARIVAQRAADDPHLFHLDGRELYGEADTDALPLPDRLHPDAATHRLIAERFAERAFGDGGPFAVAGRLPG